MPKKEASTQDLEVPLFETVELQDVPKTHKGKQNARYDEVISAFQSAQAKAIKVNCAGMGEVKSTSVAHTFRMKISERKLAWRVQLIADKDLVYLVKKEEKQAKK